MGAIKCTLHKMVIYILLLICLRETLGREVIRHRKSDDYVRFCRSPWCRLFEYNHSGSLFPDNRVIKEAAKL